jgi:hypothetical protein
MQRHVPIEQALAGGDDSVVEKLAWVCDSRGDHYTIREGYTISAGYTMPG